MLCLYVYFHAMKLCILAYLFKDNPTLKSTFSWDLLEIFTLANRLRESRTFSCEILGTMNSLILKAHFSEPLRTFMLQQISDPRLANHCFRFKYFVEQLE